MIKEAIQYLIELGNMRSVEINGLQYAPDGLDIVAPPIMSPLKIRSLLGFTQLISAGFEKMNAEDLIIHVESPTEVVLLANASDKYGRRFHSIVADCSGDNGKFQFGQFMDPEQFVIHLLSLFVQDAPDMQYLLTRASNIASESVSLAEDDGVSQKATFKRGVFTKAEETVRARVKLAPYRTFREVDQPVSEFLFRLRSRERAPPLCALFEADGGKWKLDAISNVAIWLSKNTDKIPVIS